MKERNEYPGPIDYDDNDRKLDDYDISIMMFEECFTVDDMAHLGGWMF